MLALQGPLPAAFQPFIHHVYVLPGMSVTSGEIEQVPVPLTHPTSAAVYQFWISVPEGALTQSWYQVAGAPVSELTAFQV